MSRNFRTYLAPIHMLQASRPTSVLFTQESNYEEQNGNLNEIVDMRYQPIHAHFNQHDKSATDVLPHVRILIARQEE